MDYLQHTFNWAKLQPPIFRIRTAAGLLLPKRNFILVSNQARTHPFAKKYQKNKYAIHLHAETHCLVRFFGLGYNLKELRQATMYVARAVYVVETQNFRMGMCKPCAGCERALLDFGVKQVFYTTDDQKVERLW